MTDKDEIYTGETKKGKPHGFGRCDYPDKSWYIGEWKNGKKHGQGHGRSSSGISYMGRYTDGEYGNFGTLYPMPGNKELVLTSGQFSNDAFNGLGLVLNEHGGPSYAGQLKNSSMSGVGCWFYPDGRITAGQNTTGDGDAVSLEINSDGTHKISHYRDGLLHGDLISWLPDGSKIIYNYENGEQSGPATIYRPDGSITVGIIDEAGFQGEFMTIGNNGIKIFKYFKDDKQIGNVTVVMPDGKSSEFTLKEAKRMGI